jgi:hypothetical protein
MKAKITKLIPHESETHWMAELKKPLEVRRTHTPLSGDRMILIARLRTIEYEVPCVSQFRRGLFYVVLDNGGENGKCRVCGR